MKQLLSILLLFTILSSNAQVDKKTWIVENTHEFESLDFLDSIVKNQQFVFIGESSHGAAEFFDFRVEVIKYLVKEKNFEVVAFESPFLASYFYNHKKELRIDSLTHMEQVLFPIFCNRVNKSLFDTLDNLDVPIEGFDNQLGTEFQAANVTFFVYDKLVKIDSVIAAEFLEINPLFSKSNIVRFSTKENWFNYPCNTISDSETCEYWLTKYEKFTETLISNYSELLSICNNDSLKAMATIRAVQTVQIDLQTSVSNNQLFIRDSMMAENINFLVKNVHPKKKIVFLAHNSHISKQYQKVGSNFQGDHRTMMNFLDPSLIENSVVIGLYGIQGASNNNKREPIKMVCAEQDSTLEFHLKEVVNNKAYIDVRKYPFDTDLNICLWGKWPELMNPKEQYDYLFFIKNITPSKYYEEEKLLSTKPKLH